MEPPFAITLDVGSSLANRTGSWRTERPVYVDRTTPCSVACPAGEACQAWLAAAEEGAYKTAWRRIVADNPFPAVMGRVCYAPCQAACNRGQLDEAVGLNAVERFLGDLAIESGWRIAPPREMSGKRVLVVGAGPAGMAAAYHLRLIGHTVVVVDAAPRPGGMMRFGIPRYRLPREVIDAEIDRIIELGVTLRLGTTVTDLEATMAEHRFDATFLAVGAPVGRRAYIPAGDGARVLDAVALLRSADVGSRPLIGRRVVVYGDGGQALDAARTARRLGATDAVVVYRRTRDRIPAHDLEVEEALEEGVLMRWLSTVRGAEGGRVVVERMELDDSGFPRPTGEFDELEADTVVLALGRDVDLSLVRQLEGVQVSDGVVQVGPDLMTGRPGVFAGGDMVPGDRTVTAAVGHGRRAARHIDAWLRGTTCPPPAVPAASDLATFDVLNTWYYADAPATVRPILDAARRRSTFDEVVGGLAASTALFEARRCMSCGNCFGCDNCFGVCPDNAVIKLAPPPAGSDERAYRIDLDYCKGCGICATECPCGAIRMVPEEH